MSLASCAYVLSLHYGIIATDAQNKEKIYMFNKEWMDDLNVIYINHITHTGILLSYNKGEFIPLVTKWDGSKES